MSSIALYSPLLRQPHQVPDHLQYALHLLQGNAGRGALLPDLQAPLSPAAQVN